MRKAFADVVVASRNGMVVRLADLGTVIEASASRTRSARRRCRRSRSRSSSSRTRTSSRPAAIKDAAEELRKACRPASCCARLCRQRLGGAFARRRQEHPGRGRAADDRDLPFLHSWRSTVITGLTLPIAVISAFIAVYLFGFTLNS
jgi:Cu/Ag efflux pump CusA